MFVLIITNKSEKIKLQENGESLEIKGIYPYLNVLNTDAIVVNNTFAVRSGTIIVNLITKYLQ